MQTALEELSRAMQRIGEAVYGAAAGAGASADGAGGDFDPEKGPADSGTVGGEFREV